jgi:hypothetical protein
MLHPPEAERRLIVAVEAQRRGRLDEEFRILGLVGLVAAGAHAAGYRGMRVLLHERTFVVAIIADIVRAKKLAGIR